MPVSQKPKRKQTDARKEHILTENFKSREETLKNAKYVGRMKPLNKGQYTKQEIKERVDYQNSLPK